MKLWQLCLFGGESQTGGAIHSREAVAVVPDHPWGARRRKPPALLVREPKDTQDPQVSGYKGGGLGR